MLVSVSVPISIYDIDIQRYDVSGCQYQILISETDTNIQKLILTCGCRYRVL